MAKLKTSRLLMQGGDIKSFKIKDTGVTRKAFEQTIQMQAEVLKLKEVDQDRLRIIVQL